MLRSGRFVRPLSDHIPDVQLCELKVRVRPQRDIDLTRPVLNIGATSLVVHPAK
jgi:hypothetical protein